MTTNEMPRPLTMDESDAVVAYKGDPRDSYYDERATEINGALRSGAELTAGQAKLVAALDSTFEASAPLTDRVLWRVGLPVSDDAGYLSLSRDEAREAIEDASRMIRVELPEGTRGLDMEAFNLKRFGRGDSEHEVLLPRNSRVEYYGQDGDVLLARLV